MRLLAHTDRTREGAKAVLNLYDSLKIYYSGGTMVLDDADEDVVFRTSKNGKVYALNAETGETKGLGPDIDGGNAENKNEKKPNYSATGANTDLPGFAPENLDEHWVGGGSDHSEHYPGFTKEQYALMAVGEIPIDGGFESFVEEWNARGGKILTEAYNKTR